ncbi:uncharacterized protein N7511_000714 [Penicillium nucicola]|uniref:uncharacterized protein n=1 Tax=Penicillium nucicola TaxID=1850975 RepID=UPI002544D7B4|nr:uncharacterized protein N7511_000714 [Penicillium nucicola]KAJ5775703.1 hypothetical protein N7511_000714 [Penicillium nucicola]
MKFFHLLISVGCLVVQVASYTVNQQAGVPHHKLNETRSAPVNNHTNAVSASFAGRNGLNFTIDGQANYFAGTNSYWIGFLTNNTDVDLVLDHLQHSGVRILRIWGFNDVNTKPAPGKVYFQLLQNGNATINTGPDGLQRLDYVVAAAEKRGIKLIINFVNNWSDYGGFNAYATAFGGNSTSWYTSPLIQKTYRKYVQAVVSRYSHSSAIFGWELANEPRCNGCDTSVIYNWAASTSAFIKKIDAQHMVGIGDEGFGLDVDSDGSYPYTYAEGLDFAKNLKIDTIDFGTLHLYPSTWGVANAFGNGWITAHGKACAAAHKPCIVEEYGVTSDKCNIEGQWQRTALDTEGISADLYWQCGERLSTGNSPNDDFTIYYGSDDFKCLITDHITEIGV